MTVMLQEAKLADRQPSDHSTTADVAKVAMAAALSNVQTGQEPEVLPAEADGSESFKLCPTFIQQIPAGCQETSNTPAPEVLEPSSKPECAKCIICWDALPV